MTDNIIDEKKEIKDMKQWSLIGSVCFTLLPLLYLAIGWYNCKSKNCPIDIQMTMLGISCLLIAVGLGYQYIKLSKES